MRLRYNQLIEVNSSSQTRVVYSFMRKSSVKSQRKSGADSLGRGSKWNLKNMLEGGAINLKDIVYPAKEGNQPLEDYFWYENQISELKKLERLQPNWDSYVADVPMEAVFVLTRSTIDLMFQKGIQFGKVVPSAEGGLAISFREGEKYSDIEFLNSGEILAVIHDKGEEPLVWEISDNQDDIEQTIDRMSSYLRG